MEEQKPKKRIARELKRVEGEKVYGKVGVTVREDKREVHTENDLDFIVIVGGKECDRNGKHGNVMTAGIVGAVSLMDMMDVFLSLSKTSPKMRAAMHAVVAMQKDDDVTDDIMHSMDQDEDVQETDLDDIINQILGKDNKEQ